MISREGKLSQKSLNTLMSHWSGLPLMPTLKLTTVKGPKMIMIALKENFENYTYSWQQGDFLKPIGE